MMQLTLFMAVISGFAVVKTHIRLHRLGLELDKALDGRRETMAILYIIAAIVAIFVFTYLLVALFHPEKF